MLHLGNYLGAIRNWVKLQELYGAHRSVQLCTGTCCPWQTICAVLLYKAGSEAQYIPVLEVPPLPQATAALLCRCSSTVIFTCVNFEFEHVDVSMLHSTLACRHILLHCGHARHHTPSRPKGAPGSHAQAGTPPDQCPVYILLAT